MIERIERLDGDVNAVVTRDFDAALERAAAADAAATSGQTLGALHGVPFTAKDALMTAGIRSTAGRGSSLTMFPILMPPSWPRPAVPVRS